MAIMIPETPKHYDERSREGEMFKALEQLTDSYYVFHSFKINNVANDTAYESETDFVIFHPKKGILCIEAKAGQVKYRAGQWLYANDTPMHGDGPFEQASSNKWKLMNYLKNSKAAGIEKHCKFHHAVWFPSLSETAIRQMQLPPECDKQMMIPGEALSDPEKYIAPIMELEVPSHTQTDLAPEESSLLLRSVLCPCFQVFPSSAIELETKRIIFRRLLKEQANVLNFLEDQRTAIINGAAGTGKTVIAVEKAQRHAENNEKVLFLCYNRFLCDHLRKTYPNVNITFETIHGYCCKLCGTAEVDFKAMVSKLEEIYYFGKFPYQHIIIDEGQDFGVEEIGDDVLNTLRQLILDHTERGTFYIFYDKMQLIQYHAKDIPSCIQDADCKLTLYKNCRNTLKIAETSLAPFPERKPVVNDETRETALEDSVGLCFMEDVSEVTTHLDAMLSDIRKAGYRDIVILTPKTERTSWLSAFVKNGKYKDIPFTTCRKFKGLEADAVILVDVDVQMFEDEELLLYYAGASRARFHLDLLANLSDDECISVIQRISAKNRKADSGEVKVKKPKREFAKMLKAHVMV